MFRPEVTAWHRTWTTGGVEALTQERSRILERLLGYAYVVAYHGDGSVFERLNLLYGRTKHPEKAINSGQLPPCGTLPVWLTNPGLCAVDAELTFTEMAEFLTHPAKWADAAHA
jgi:hypothetical protein